MPYFDKVLDTDVEELVQIYFKEYDPTKRGGRTFRGYGLNSARRNSRRRLFSRLTRPKASTNFDDLGDVDIEKTGKGFVKFSLASQRLMAEELRIRRGR